MFEKIKAKIEKADNILILTHSNPDGDALGSTVGFKYLLKDMGKRAEILLEKEPAPLFSCFGDEFIWGEPHFSYDLAVSLDCGDELRLGTVAEYFKGETVNIDHHISNTEFGKVNYIDPSAAATGEIICALYEYFRMPFTKEAASALYGAILTDTGGFMFSNTTEKTHMFAAKLIKAGADYYNLNKKLIQEKDYKRHRLSAYMIDNMKFLCGGEFALCVLDNELCSKLEIKDDDLNGLAQVPRTVSGVEVGVLISEITRGLVKVSLRSDCRVNVSEIASRFGGGGHIRASGIKILNKDIREVEKELTLEIKKELEG